jgi:single-stranded DNA-binding protein
MAFEVAYQATLTRAAEVKTSSAGKPYLRLTALRIGDGDKVQWINAIAFDPDAIATADKFVKGARVYIEGRLTLDKWKAADGSERSGLSCVAFHCRLAQIGRNRVKRPRSDAAPALAPAAPGKQHADFDDEIPGWAP